MTLSKQAAAAPGIETVCKWTGLNCRTPMAEGDDLHSLADSGPGFQAHSVDTSGGKAPTPGCSAANVGESARVAYSADYQFYGTISVQAI